MDQGEFAHLSISRDGPSAADLYNTEWILVELGEGEPVVDDAEVTIHFEEGQISGSGGCNSYTGSFTLGEDNPFVMTIGPVAATAMACPDPIGSQESAGLCEHAMLADCRSPVQQRIMDQRSAVLLRGRRASLACCRDVGKFRGPAARPFTTGDTFVCPP